MQHKDRRNYRQTGFTLIELVVVVSIIAIMSAIALPRYINMQTQARVAKAQAILGSVKSAAALARAACMVDRAGLTATTPTCTATGGTVNMDGVLVSMINEFPAASLDGIVRAAQLDEAADQIDITAGAATAPLTIDIVGGTAPNCRITYMPATAGPAFTPPGLVSTGC